MGSILLFSYRSHRTTLSVAMQPTTATVAPGLKLRKTAMKCCHHSKLRPAL